MSSLLIPIPLIKVDLSFMKGMGMLSLKKPIF